VVGIWNGEDILLHDQETGETAFGCRKPDERLFTNRKANDICNTLNAQWRPTHGYWGGYEVREKNHESDF
jgi:hypothetical protein